jgi:hypothetical protein
MRKREKRRRELGDGGRATAATTLRGKSNAGSSLESILDIVSKATRQVPKRDWARFRSTCPKTSITICTARRKKRNGAQPMELSGGVERGVKIRSLKNQRVRATRHLDS